MVDRSTLYSFVFGAAIVLLLASGRVWLDGDRPGFASPSAAASASDCDEDSTAPVLVAPVNGFQAALSGCENGGSQAFFFSVTASDNCDPDPQLSVAASDGLYLEPLNNRQYLLLAPAGSYTVEVTATDLSGNQQSLSLPVEVTQEPAPGANYACNDAITVALNDACQRRLTPDMVLEGDIGCYPAEYFEITVLDDTPANGPLIDGPGTYDYELQPVQPAPVAGFTGSFRPQQWSTLGTGGGTVVHTADSLILSGDSDDYAAVAVYSAPFNASLSLSWAAQSDGGSHSFSGLIIGSDGSPAGTVVVGGINDAGTANINLSAGQSLVWQLAGNGNAKAVVTAFSASFTGLDPGLLFPCWGEVTALDEQPPTLICPEDTETATLYTDLQIIAGSLDENDPLLSTQLYSCLIENFASPGARHYELIEFEVDAEDVYTFFLEAGFEADMAVFQRSFNPLSPCTNIIGQADFPQAGNPLGGGNNPLLRTALPLRPGQSYFLLTSSDEPGQTGDYQYAILSDNGGSIIGFPQQSRLLTYPLYCNDVTFVQNADSLQWTGAPEVSDNCSQSLLTFNDIPEEEGDCGSLRIRRFFRATDEAGNQSNCIQNINFRRPGIEDVLLPPFTMPIECDEDFPLDELGGPDPEFTGYPFILTAQGAIDLRDDYCNLGATYEDGPNIELCPSSFQFVRRWTIIDWCEPANTEVYAQIIKIGDFTAPEVECPVVDIDGDGFPDELVYPAASFECEAAFVVPAPQVVDNCSNWSFAVEVVTDEDSIVFNDFGQPVDTVVNTVVLASVPATVPNKTVAGIPSGCHRFRYIVSDDCGNTSVLECGFCVEDESDPVAICDDEVIVSLGGNGESRLFANHINEGSWDNCGIDSLAVRRRVTLNEDCEAVAPFFTPWSASVTFNCCEINTLQGVELLVIDTAGNTNVCATEVLVEDKTNPSCLPPDPVTMSCADLPPGFSADSLALLGALFGEPGAIDNCGASWQELPPVSDIDDCGVGTLIRRFRAVDASGNTSALQICNQTVTLTAEHDYLIKFPEDGYENCGAPNADTIEVFEQACDLLAVSVTDTLFSASGDECYKIFRTYRVINWCEYDGQSEPVVISRDEDCDENPGDEDVWVIRHPDQAFVDRDDMPFNNNPAAGQKGTICTGQTNPQGFWRNTVSRGFWQYEQHLLVYDTVAPQILFPDFPPICSNNNATCRAPAEFPIVISDDCTPNDLDIRVFYDEYADGTIDTVLNDIFGTYPKYKISGDYPIGMHEFKIVVEDGCGNVASATLPFEIVDCKAPAPACLNGISLSLMPLFPETDADGDGDIDRGALNVFAEDFIVSEYIDCSMPLRYSINRVGETPDINQDEMIVTCDDLGVLLVEIYAWDAAGNPFAVQPDGSIGGPNYDNCETFIVVNDNIADCDEQLPLLAGAVERPDSVGVGGVLMSLTGNLTSEVLTDSLGQYVLDDLESGYSYTLTPSKDGDDQNGLSTFDIALINQHVLGRTPFDSPYKFLAADVNNSGSISTLDILQLRQVILSIITEFPNTDSWRFVPKSHEFINPDNPWASPIPNSIYYDELEGELLAEDFVAIKMGDIDYSSTVAAQSGQLEPRYEMAHVLQAEEQWLQAGQRVRVPVYADMNQLIGLQGLLDVDINRVTLERVEEGVLTEAHFNARHLPSGQLPVSWTGSQQSGKHRLFTLHLKVLQSGKLSDALHLADGPLRPEAYDDQLRKRYLHLSFNNTYAVPVLTPNPVREAATLYFELSRAEQVKVSVYDLQGQPLLADELQCSEGANHWELPVKKLPADGVYLLHFQSSTQSWTQKFVLAR